MIISVNGTPPQITSHEPRFASGALFIGGAINGAIGGAISKWMLNTNFARSRVGITELALDKRIIVLASVHEGSHVMVSFVANRTLKPKSSFMRFVFIPVASQVAALAIAMKVTGVSKAAFTQLLRNLFIVSSHITLRAIGAVVVIGAACIGAVVVIHTACTGLSMLFSRAQQCLRQR